MYEQQVELESKLDKLDNIQIVNGFYARKNPTGPKLTEFMCIGGALFFFVGLFLAIVLDAKRSKR